MTKTIRKSPTRTVRILKEPSITVRIDSRACVGLPWQRGFKYTSFRGTVFIEGEEMASGIPRESPNEAVQEALGALYRFLQEAARKVDTIEPFYRDGNMHTVRDGSALSRTYWLIEGTHEEDEISPYKR